SSAGPGASASTIKIRNLAHLLQQLDELGHPQHAGSSAGTAASESDTDRHLYGGSSGSGTAGAGPNRASGRFAPGRLPPGAVQAGLGGLDSTFVDHDLAYLLGATDPAAFRRAAGARLSLDHR